VCWVRYEISFKKTPQVVIRPLLFSVFYLFVVLARPDILWLKNNATVMQKSSDLFQFHLLQYLSLNAYMANCPCKTNLCGISKCHNISFYIYHSISPPTYVEEYDK
jgi:hypothetical protein